jgi:hypothetical protein
MTIFQTYISPFVTQLRYLSDTCNATDIAFLKNIKIFLPALHGLSTNCCAVGAIISVYVYCIEKTSPPAMIEVTEQSLNSNPTYQNTPSSPLSNNDAFSRIEIYIMYGAFVFLICCILLIVICLQRRNPESFKCKPTNRQFDKTEFRQRLQKRRALRLKEENANAETELKELISCPIQSQVQDQRAAVVRAIEADSQTPQIPPRTYLQTSARIETNPFLPNFMK